ncbi:hypothetical protein V2I84_05080 [Pseudomonas viridiflava]|uniref:hypothetical protein n=1 Tax=Pseudomonas viridiflava TaxID=33069 RepID=UPI002EB830BE|nr:hypothetical protein [Pseudomonas viridiflava]MEE3980827.1 hypothetical protein [Pseudomonas viridiflava]MEE3989561.1 hypothetical protein [Pseudomonas viridiflava]MEE4028107.1 hypothetical protein [Pseudomonas viridiflava]MEE4034271.1 hypothetical protein [Pseudomonas viridiflava]
MAYGVQFINNNNVVTLDSEFSRLSVIASGRFQPTEESGLGSTTYFPVAVTSQEPPLVFVRPDTVNAVAGLCRMRLIGSAGNWTGFYVRAYNVNTAQPNGRYFVAAFGAQPVSGYGMRIWDGSSKLLFDTGTVSANFTRSFQNWNFVKSDLESQGLTRIYYTVNFNFPENEYLLINSFGMPLNAGSAIAREIACWWDFPGSTLYAITVAASNPIAFFLPAVFAKMNV